jgi:chromosomal replication initiation ATPase DnaA
MTFEERTAGEREVPGILSRVCAHYGITHDELVGPRRPQHVADARAFAAWLLRERGIAYQRIAALLGRQDHSTVLRGVRKVEAARSSDGVARTLEKLRCGA